MHYCCGIFVNCVQILWAISKDTVEAVLKFNIQESKAVFEELFNGAIPIFVASLVPELFTSLLENQREQTIVWHVLN